MDIRYLYEFLDLAETCNFQETADNLYLSPATLTKHIQKIESELGVQLFSRNTRKVTLNQYGVAFCDYARRLCELNDECLRAMKTLKNRTDSQLMIGALGHINFYGLYEFLDEFKRSFPGIDYQVVEEKDNELKAKLDNDEISFIFSTNSKPYHNFNCKEWKSDPLVLICSEDDEIAAKQSIKIKEFENLDLISHGPPIEYPDFDRACRAVGFAPRTSNRVAFSSTILQLVKAGQGVSVISRSMLSGRDLDGIVCVPIDPTIYVHIYIVWKDHDFLPMEKCFLNFIENGDQQETS